MTLKESFDVAQSLKALREEKSNRLTRIASEQQLVDACESRIVELMSTLTEEDNIVINQLIG